MAYRDHEPTRIEKFNGLWKRGDAESCPLDHFTEAQNISYFPDGFGTREGITSTAIDEQGTIIPAVRQYTYVRQNEASLLVLDPLGNIYHTGAPVPSNPILSIPEMTDFAFQAVSGRAYISPHNGVTGLQGEFLYVYMGDGNPARKAGGAPPITAPTISLGTFLNSKLAAGWHVFGVVYETDTGYLTQIGPVAAYQTLVVNKLDLSDIPISPDIFVVARHIVASKVIDPVLYTGNPDEYELYFVPDGRIADNSTTTFTADYYESELVSSASRLEDLFTEIAAGVSLTSYHNRLILSGQYGVYDPDPDVDTYPLISTARVSLPGEPEAFDQVDGLIVAPLDDKPLTNAQEYRDILYLFKDTKTFAYNDNGDVPSTWIGITLDQGLGTSVHGVATVLDSGGISIDYLVICNFAGVYVFNGSYIDPELSYKMESDWQALDRDNFNLIQAVNDVISKQIFIVLPNGLMLFGDYTEGLDPMKIKWGYFKTAAPITTIAMLNESELIIGTNGAFV